MKISLTSRHLKPTKELKNYAKERLRKVKKYLSEPIEANIILTWEKFRHIVEITINHSGITIRGEEVATDMRAAIDKAMEKIEKQLRRQKDKLYDKKRAKEKWRS
jgi:putative sigma-54 modulation protein